MNEIRLGISTGDFNGIGPEIIIKALNDPNISKLAEYFIYGSEKIFEYSGETLSTGQDISNGLETVISSVVHSGSEPEHKDFVPSQSSKISGNFAYQSLSKVLEHWLEGRIDGIVTAPVQKSTFFPERSEFNGQTEWIADRIGCKDSLMFMIKDWIRIATVTTHISVKDIPGKLTQKIIVEKAKLVFDSLKQDFGIEKPSIALCGLNPHCGEEGRFGDEESTIIKPAINSLKNEGGQWTGPLPADTVFTEKSLREYDAVVSMYHDQGLIPFKIYSGLSGVNFTAGMPLVRTSPDHGTALDIAGKGIADESGMKKAIRTAIGIIKRRTGKN